MDNLFSNIQKSFKEVNNGGINSNNKKSLLESQQISQQKINDLLEKSSQALMCGPTCQKIRVTDELKQKYLDAETNLLTAPIKLEQSKKNYYIWTEGRTYYNDMKEEELNEKANKISELIEENFNNEVSSANTMNTYLNTTLKNSENTKELLKQYLEKNEELKLKLRERHGDILTNDRKTYYEVDALNRLELWYRLFWYIYYLLVLVLILAMFLSPSNLTIIKKVIIVIIFVLYPYFINFITKWIYGLWINMVNRIPKNVYNNL